MNTFCTIVTPNYLAYILALFESLKEHGLDSVKMYALISTTKSEKENIAFPEVEGVEYLFIDDLCNEGAGRMIKDKYLESDVHAFRWSMKPVLLNYLLKDEECEKVIYVDGDIFFFSNYQFLFDKLNDARAILTPHWRSFDPHKDLTNFELMFNSGIYNAGFIAVNKKAIEIMEWWAMACVFRCVKDPSRGFFADQTYLNLLNVIFEGVELLRHRGCNLADWNQLECRRTKRPDGSVCINNEYPVVFIHFTFSTMLAILENRDPLLLPHLKRYFQSVKNYGIDLEKKIMQDIELRAQRMQKQKLALQKSRKGFLYFRFKSIVKKMLDKIITH